MPHPNTGPFAIRNGIAYPISPEEFRRTTGRQATASAAPPRAPATAAPRDPPAPKFDSRAFSTANMRSQLERQGLPSDSGPRAAEPSTPHDPLDSRAFSRANMVAELRKQGLEPVQRP